MSLKDKMIAAAEARKAAAAGTVTPPTQTATPVKPTPVAPVVEAVTTVTDSGEVAVVNTAAVAGASAPVADKPKRTRLPKVQTIEEVAAASPVAQETRAPKVEAPGTALAVADDESQAVVVASSHATPIGQIAGNVSTSDLKLPWLGHVQSVGDLSASFQAGSILLDGEVAIAKPDPAQPMKCSEELYMIPIRAARVLRENFDFKDPSTKGKMAREFASEEEVLANGGIIDYNQGANHFRPALNVLAAIAREITDVTPELEPYFVDIDNEAGIALAVCTIRFANSAFTRAGRTIITDQARVLRSEKYGLLSAFYSYKLERVQVQSGDWIWCPTIRLLRERTEMSTRELLVSIYS